MRKRRVKAITLIEILLVMSLIGMAVGAMQFGVHKLLKKEAFVQEVRKIRNMVAFAQEVMIDTKCDLSLTLLHEGSDVKLLFSSTPELPERVARTLQDITVRHVETLTFNEAVVSELILNFEGHLGIISEGVIEIKSKKEKSQTIHLRGFPGRVL